MHFSADFYLYSTLGFLFLSTLPFLMMWVSKEKTFPFSSQRETAYIYVVTSLLMAIFLSSHSIFYQDFTIEVAFNEDLNQILIRGLTSSFLLEPMGSSMIYNSILVSFSRVFLLFASVVSIILSSSYLVSVRYNYFEYYLFIMYSTLAMLVLVSSNNALLTYLAIELQSLSLYLLAASQRKSIHSVEAGLKYLFIGSLASGFLLLGFSYLYMLTGTLDFSQMALVIDGISYSHLDPQALTLDFLLSPSTSTEEKFYLLGRNISAIFYDYCYLLYKDFLFLHVSVAFIMLSLFIKLAAAPFHLWLSDVYEGSPSSATTYFLLVPKIAVLTVLYRVTYEVFDWNFRISAILPDNFLPRALPVIFDLLSPALFFFIIYSFIIGYSGILKSGITLKRLFAFSSIGHLGFILLPFITILDDALYSIAFYFLLYFLITIPSIRAMLILTSPKVDFSSGRRIHYSIESYPSSFHLINPSNALFIFSLFITFVGIPPTAGFFMKLYPLISVVSEFSSLTFFVWPAIVLSSYVYVRVIVQLFYTNFDMSRPRLWSPLFIDPTSILSTWISISSVLFLSTYAFGSPILESLCNDLVTDFSLFRH